MPWSKALTTLANFVAYDAVTFTLPEIQLAQTAAFQKCSTVWSQCFTQFEALGAKMAKRSNQVFTCITWICHLSVKPRHFTCSNSIAKDSITTNRGQRGEEKTMRELQISKRGLQHQVVPPNRCKGDTSQVWLLQGLLSSPVSFGKAALVRKEKTTTPNMIIDHDLLLAPQKSTISNYE